MADGEMLSSPVCLSDSEHDKPGHVFFFGWGIEKKKLYAAEDGQNPPLAQSHRTPD